MSRRVVPHVFVGCGNPGKSMGWLHILQVLDGLVPTARVSGVVEPFFLGAGKGMSPTYEEFEKTHSSVPFVANIADLESPTEPTVACISTRTADMPLYFKQLVEKGYSHIYLE